MTDYSCFKCKFIPKDQIWSMADEFRLKYCPLKKLPVDIEKIIESDLNMFIIPESNIHEYAKIDAYLRSDFSGIVVDEKQYMDVRDRYKSRLRFSFAHEVGHYILHKYVYSQLEFGSPKDLFNFIMNVPESEYNDFEWQANEFAGRLLVPRDALVTEIEKILIMLKNHSLLEMLQTQSDQVLERVSPHLCKPFGVSEKVIEMRVQREGLWPPIV